MTLDKRIYRYQMSDTRNDYYANGFIIGNYSRYIATVRELAAVAMADFPHLKETDIEVGIIVKSTYNKGFLYVRFPLHGEPIGKSTITEYKGYPVLYSRLDFEGAE